MLSSALLLKLLFAHLMGDFVLQTDKWVTQKENKTWRAPFMYGHAVLHGLLVWLVVWQRDFWPYALAVAATHLTLDISKAMLQKRYPQQAKSWFLADQLLHILILGTVTVLFTQAKVWPQLSQIEIPWKLITAYLFVTKPASIVIKVMISHWKPNPLVHLPDTREPQPKTSLAEAGMWIGIIERLLVLTFILKNHWEAIGFLLAAKSVFRFGDLRGKHDMQLTEYILIGTLMSFGIAILTGLLVS